ncbi:MAG: TonB-dependent receptor [Bacteroidales bacterium]
MRTKFLLTLIISLFGLNLIAVEDKSDNEIAAVEGHVVDSKTKKPIPYVNIGVVNTNIGTITNDEGDFVIRILKPGKYTLRASSLGYKTKEIEIIVQTKKSTHAHFELEESKIIFDEIVVSANRNEVLRKEAPVIVNVLSNKDFEANNAQDLSQALGLQTGIRVDYNCQNCGVPQVRLNGLEGPYTQMLIDSRPVLSALGSVYGLEQIPVNMIERVEVVKGGGSALYGSNAIAGTINIITKEATRPSFSIANDLQLVGMNSIANNFNMNGALINSTRNSGVSFYQTFRKKNPYDANNDGYSEIGKMDAFSFGTKVYHKFTPSQKLTMEYHTTQETRRGGNKFEQPVHLADITEMTEHKIHSGGVTYDYTSMDGLNRVSAYASGQYVDRDSYFGTHQDPNAFGKSNDLTYLLGVQANNEIEKLLFTRATLTYGLEYNSNRLKDEMIGYNRHIDQKTNIMGTFFQSEWKASLYSFLIGGRLEKNNLIDNLILSPRANFLFKPSDEFQLRASYANGYRAPQAYDEDLHVLQVGGEAVLLTLNKDLEQEVSNSFSLSTDIYKQLSYNIQTNILIEGFYTDLANAFALRDLGYDSTNNAVIKERYNASGARIMGGSITAKLAYKTNYVLTLGYTLQNNEYKETEYWSEDPSVEGTKKMMRTPDSYGFLSISAQPINPLNLSLTGTYTGEMLVPHYAGYIAQDKLERTPDFFDLNLTANYNFKLSNSLGLQLNAGVKNIFNSYQSDFDKGVNRDAGYIYGPMQPRTIFVGLKLVSL